MFLLFFFLQSWFLWQGFSESTAKRVSWKMEILKSKTPPSPPPADKGQTADTKKVFLAKHYWKYYHRTWKNTPPQHDSNRTGRPLFTEEAPSRSSGQTLNAGKRKRRNCLRNTWKNGRKKTQCKKEKKNNKKNLTNDQFNICLSFFYIHIYFFYILLSPQWNSMHWLGDPKKNE